jgi:hypothetical protein
MRWQKRCHICNRTWWIDLLYRDDISVHLNTPLHIGSSHEPWTQSDCAHNRAAERVLVKTFHNIKRVYRPFHHWKVIPGEWARSLQTLGSLSVRGGSSWCKWLSLANKGSKKAQRSQIGCCSQTHPAPSNWQAGLGFLDMTQVNFQDRF